MFQLNYFESNVGTFRPRSGMKVPNFGSSSHAVGLSIYKCVHTTVDIHLSERGLSIHIQP